MESVWIIFILTVIMIRFIAPYDSSYMNEKYIVIKNPKLRSLLIDKMRFWDESDRRKKDINKITITGIALYIYAGISAILSVLSYVFVSKSRVEPWMIEHDIFDMRLDTLNECFAAGFIFSFLLLYFGVIGVRMFQYAKKCDAKWEKAMRYTFSLIFIGFCIAIPIIFLCGVSI